MLDRRTRRADFGRDELSTRVGSEVKDGGYYDDVYEKTAQGNWRFKSRVYVAESPARTQ